LVPQLGWVLVKPSCILQQGAWTHQHRLLTLQEAFVRAIQVKHQLLGEHLGRPLASLLRMKEYFGQRITAKLVPKKGNLGFLYSFCVGFLKLIRNFILIIFSLFLKIKL
jgi:hypothetical protein